MPVPESWLRELERVTADPEQPSLEHLLKAVLEAARTDGVQASLLQLAWLQFVVLADIRRVLQEILAHLARVEQRVR